ncbi:MAG: hypothetical protein AB1443_04935 [Pseudomonadota bacterium]
MKTGRLTWLLLALVATAAVAAFGDAQEAPATAAAVPMPAERHVAIRVLLPRQYVPAPAGDPFAIPLPAQAAPAERPDAVPPAPTFSAASNWRVLGKQQADGEGWTVFLARGEETCVVRAGDTLDERYRVLAIVPPTLTLQHLKNKTKYTLDIGDARE